MNFEGINANDRDEEKYDGFKGKKHLIDTSVGKVFVLELGESQGPTCLLIHGWSKSAGLKQWKFMFEPLIKEGYRVFAIDMPGFGHSQSAIRLFSARSDDNLLKDGPVDVIEQILNKLNIDKFNIFGFSWGGGVAISLAIKFKSRILKIALLMPSYTEQKDELKQINVSTLILWIKEDQIHPYKLGRLLASRIKLCTLIERSIGTLTISSEDNNRKINSFSIPVFTKFLNEN
ncbi:unnamed protein product [Brachionus calyciflorus]|uniref:AB hydrolase-1 domain-containing protein n=1 Tax=Brachionus calyciflorus TaxID=104777 RepID=A0A814HDM2_9BILA|nr:unnamed protein product [Brachionus calyciflorus]